MPEITKISDVPTPKVPLLRGDAVAREWLYYFETLRKSRDDIEDLIEGYYKHFLMMGA